MTKELKGRLRALALPDILEFLKISQNTGVLTFTREEAQKELYISRGNVVFAASNLAEDRLGDLLLREGKITRKQYDESVRLLKETGHRQGRNLVEVGALTPQGLWEAVRAQIKHIVYSVFDWEDGEFSFEERPLPREETITVDVGITELIVGGIRRIQNRKLLENWLPERNVVLKLAIPQNNPVVFEEYERHIIGFINGERKVAEIIDASEIGAFETLKVLYMLSSIGYASMQTPILPEKTEPAAKDIIKEYNAVFSYLNHYLKRELGPLAMALFEKYLRECASKSDAPTGLLLSSDGTLPENQLTENFKKAENMETFLQNYLMQILRGLRAILGDDHALHIENTLQGLRMRL